MNINKDFYQYCTYFIPVPVFVRMFYMLYIKKMISVKIIAPQN